MNSKENVLLTKQETIDVRGDFKKNWAEAYDSCFEKMRHEILRPKDRVVLKIELLEVRSQNKEIKERKERFLFVFLPVRKIEYGVELSLLVEIKYMEL